MNTKLGRWLFLSIILIIALSLALLIVTVMRLAQAAPPAVAIRPTDVPTEQPTPVPPTAHVVYVTVTPTPVPPTVPTATPTAAPSATPLPTVTPLPPPIGYAIHVCSEGDTLEEVSARYGGLAHATAYLNRLPDTAPLGEGQPLVVPLFAGIEPGAPFEVRGLEISRGLEGRRVALTFDAGASAAPASSILDTLRDHDVQVTFFLTGKWAEDNPDLVRRMAAEGHEFANHTYNHPQLTDLDEAGIRDQVTRTEVIIRNLVGQSSRPYLRPPFGARNRYVLDVLAGEGYISIYWTVDSWDSVGEPKTPQFLVERVTHPQDAQGNPISLEGAIILMHVGSQPTAEALPAILTWYQQNDWEVVPISEILRPTE